MKPLEILFISSLTPKDTQSEERSFTHLHTCCDAVLLLPFVDHQWILFWAAFCVKAEFHLLLKGQRRVEYRKPFNIGIKRFPVKPYSHVCSLWSTGESRMCGSGPAVDSQKTKANQMRKAEEENTSLPTRALSKKKPQTNPKPNQNPPPKTQQTPTPPKKKTTKKPTPKTNKPQHPIPKKNNKRTSLQGVRDGKKTVLHCFPYCG